MRVLGLREVNRNVFCLAEFIQETYAAAALSATMHGCTFRILPVEPELAVRGARALFIAAVANQLQNAFKITAPGTEVLLTAYAQGARILIDVKDRCGGLAAGVEDTMFLPFSQSENNRAGISLGLTIAKQTVASNGGVLTVHSMDGIGCVFTISLPCNSMQT